MRVQMELEWVLGRSEIIRETNNEKIKGENNVKYREITNIKFLKICVYKWEVEARKVIDKNIVKSDIKCCGTNNIFFLKIDV